jgi:hypothetical protein
VQFYKFFLDKDDDKNNPFRIPTEEEQKQAWDQMKRFFAISLFIFGLYILMRGPEQAPVMVKETTWSDFVSKLLPTGQVILRILTFTIFVP